MVFLNKKFKKVLTLLPRLIFFWQVYPFAWLLWVTAISATSLLHNIVLVIILTGGCIFFFQNLLPLQFSIFFLMFAGSLSFATSFFSWFKKYSEQIILASTIFVCLFDLLCPWVAKYILYSLAFTLIFLENFPPLIFLIKSRNRVYCSLWDLHYTRAWNCEIRGTHACFNCVSLLKHIRMKSPLIVKDFMWPSS